MHQEPKESQKKGQGLKEKRWISFLFGTIDASEGINTGVMQKNSGKQGFWVSRVIPMEQESTSVSRQMHYNMKIRDIRFRNQTDLGMLFTGLRRELNY
ncbi:protein ROOT PRIMORDIUM DEFECTIVE 1-like [Pyrus ussuriensis x Pyrus communis]|uniref:Protein ROOT PRIMORDIUM DEFECTIVE 1-like n=1 Tax=Pyrus ussuriensis x Pyrus communis TaxID=2448454 RepID=A0A5N5GW81_9ROSA|nr:protein ROOT PRIMORDIUM DEFECTIVE 1-like [Pyrus ussuriensis x Pyrus communis]